MENKIRVTLLGQPNVGKSSLFSRMTGVGVIISNYSGTTVQFEEASVVRNGKTIVVRDLPGTYSVSGNTPDEKVVTKALTEDPGDVVVVIADASNLEGSLVLCFEVMELGLPTILVLNKTDSASKKFDTDIDELGRILGIDVIPVSAKLATGVDVLMDCISNENFRRSDYKIRYDSHTEEYLKILEKKIDVPGYSSRGIAVNLLEMSDIATSKVPEHLIRESKKMAEEFKTHHAEVIDIHIARDRYGESGVIRSKVQKKTERSVSRAERISEILTAPVTGIPILIGILFLMFIVLIFVGNLLDKGISDAYSMLVGTSLIDFGVMFGGEIGAVIMHGIDESIRAILGIIIPYVVLFYILLGIMEDTGYLPRAVVLLDRTMHGLGLHGGAFIPMMVGVGCNVPAIMATRIIQSKRERIILSTLIIMAVPCSAQLAIIFGAVGVYSGILAAFSIFIVLLLIIVIAGHLMNKWMKKEPSNFAMEMPELSAPTVKNVLYKTWNRAKDFFTMAFPLLVVGSIVVQILLYYDLLAGLVEPFSFLTVTMLGLPAVTIIAFLVGILRKEMAIAMLLVLAGMPLNEFMSPDQFLVFGIVMAIYIPCIATISVLWKEFGPKNTVIISVASLSVAILVGTAFNLALHLF